MYKDRWLNTKYFTLLRQNTALQIYFLVFIFPSIFSFPIFPFYEEKTIIFRIYKPLFNFK